jgi:hypothetical protein
MKKLTAGFNPDTVCSGEGLNCLICYTPGGVQTWCRSNTDSDPTQECQDIYPAYGGSVTGNWGNCSMVIEG